MTQTGRRSLGSGETIWRIARCDCSSQQEGGGGGGEDVRGRRGEERRGEGHTANVVYQPGFPPVSAAVGYIIGSPSPPSLFVHLARILSRLY